MPQNEMLLFCGRNRIRYGYARWGYTRGGGKTWHGGADVEGLDDTTIRMPGYGLGAGRHAISGTVVTARRVAQSTGNPTWEWGWYVCVKLDANQTPDAVNYLYFCHNAKNLAAVGQRVKTGDALAVMGNTGNAALASPPYAHCHFEVRATATGRGLNPAQYMGFENAVGTFGTAPQRFAPFSSGECLVCARGSGPLSAGDIQLLKAWAESKALSEQAVQLQPDGSALVGPLSAGDQIFFSAAQRRYVRAVWRFGPDAGKIPAAEGKQRQGAHYHGRQPPERAHRCRHARRANCAGERRRGIPLCR